MRRLQKGDHVVLETAKPQQLWTVKKVWGGEIVVHIITDLGGEAKYTLVGEEAKKLMENEHDKFIRITHADISELLENA
jgi:hypothetical protein